VGSHGIGILDKKNEKRNPAEFCRASRVLM